MEILLSLILLSAWAAQETFCLNNSTGIRMEPGESEMILHSPGLVKKNSSEKVCVSLVLAEKASKYFGWIWSPSGTRLPPSDCTSEGKEIISLLNAHRAQNDLPYEHIWAYEQIWAYEHMSMWVYMSIWAYAHRTASQPFKSLVRSVLWPMRKLCQVCTWGKMKLIIMIIILSADRALMMVILTACGKNPPSWPGEHLSSLLHNKVPL